MKKKLPTMNNESDEIPNFNLDEYICRATPCVIVNPQSPYFFFAKILSKRSACLRKEMDNAIAEIYQPFIHNVKSDDPEICEMQEMFQEATDAMEKNEEPLDILCSRLKNYIGDHGVIYLKSNFYRVAILDWNIEDMTCKVIQIDEGLVQSLSVFEILPMANRLKKYPYFILPCHLNDILPPDNEQKWSTNSIDVFKKLVNTQEVWLLFIFPPDEKRITTPVNIFWPETDSVSNQMVRSSAAFLDDNEEDMVDLEFGVWDPMEVEYESVKNNYQINVDDPSVAIYGYVGKDDEEICPYFGRNGYCYKGDACRKQHIRIDPSLVTNLSQGIYGRAKVELPDIYLNTSYEIYNLVFGDNCNVVLKQDFEMYQDDLRSMLKKLNDPINVGNLMRLSVPPALGEIVIVDSDDSLWVRARCINSDLELDSYDLQVVDSGIVLNTNISKLRNIDAEYLKVPFMSREVILDGVEISNAPINSDLINKIIETSTSWSMEIVGYLELPVVKITTNHNKSLSDIIIELNYGVKCKWLMADKNSRCLPG